MRVLAWIDVLAPDSLRLSIAGDQLMIFLEGGGSCWNTYSCSQNPATFVPPASFALSNGVFDRSNPANPVKDWNLVYVPYCTGDAHAGSNPGFDPGPGPQQLVGYTNIEKFLDRLVPTFPNVTKVLHTGFSAGGYGALLTVELVGSRFPSSADVVLVIDSAPPLPMSALVECIQTRKVTTFGFEETFLAECGADCPEPSRYLIDYPKHLVTTYPDRRIGLIETIADSAILSAFGYTAEQCTGDVTAAPVPMAQATFEAGLLELRTEMAAAVPDGGTSSFGTFYLQGSQHGWLTFGDALYTASAGGQNLIDWFTAVVEGEAPTHVGP